MSDAVTTNVSPSNVPAGIIAGNTVEPKPIPGKLQIPDGNSPHEWQALHRAEPVKQPEATPVAKPEPVKDLNADPQPTQDAAPGDQPTEQEQPAVSATDLEALQRYREWEASEDLPKEFLTKKIEVPTEHGPVYETIEGLKKGFMRRTDFHRSMDEFKAKEQGFNQRLTQYDEHFTRVKSDPEAFIEEYEENGFPLVEVATKIMERDKKDKSYALAAARNVAEQIALELRTNIDDPRVTNHRDVARAYDEAYKERTDFRTQQREMRKQARELEQLRQGHQQTQVSTEQQQRQATYKKQLDQYIPRAFTAHGLKDDPANRATFVRFLGSLMERAQTRDITPDLVAEATIMAKEELDDIRAKERSLSPQQQPNVVGTQRMGGAGKIPQAQGRQGVSVESLEAKLRPQRQF